MLVDGVSTTKFAVEQQIPVSTELTLFYRFEINNLLAFRYAFGYIILLTVVKYRTTLYS